MKIFAPCIQVIPALVAVIVLFGHVPAAHAVSTLSLAPTGNGVYELRADGLAGAAAFDITMNYDQAILSGPRVVQGPLLAGAMMAVNPNLPGTVRMGIIRTSAVSGSGLLLTISFTQKAAGPGLRGVSARLADLQGRPLDTQVRLALDADEQSPSTEAANPQSIQENEAMPGAAPAATASGNVPPAVVGMVVPPSLPAPEEHAEKQEQQEQPTEQQSPEAPASAPDRAAHLSREKERPREEASLPTIYTQPSIRERFQEYRGPRTPKALMALFDQDPLIGFRQDPAIALSDGKTPVALRFISTPDRQHTSDLALMGARLVSAKRAPDETNTWIVTVLPVQGSNTASLSVPQQKLLMVFPITVAPKARTDLDGSGSVNMADFLLFLKEQGEPGKPRFDLNHDGVRDWQDDYIFTANYLAAAHATKSARAVAPAKGATLVH